MILPGFSKILKIFLKAQLLKKWQLHANLITEVATTDGSSQGGSGIFSRGGVSKKLKFLKILTTFLLGRPLVQIDFPRSPKALKRRCFGQIFCAAGNFFGARSPSKLVYIYGQSAKNGFLKKYQRGDPLGRQGVESLKGGRPPLNPPLAHLIPRSVRCPS